jgi:hypothetical protein
MCLFSKILLPGDSDVRYHSMESIKNMVKILQLSVQYKNYSSLDVVSSESVFMEKWQARQVKYQYRYKAGNVLSTTP